jgi:O-methyltransferase involved in polyketide biosynthesis
MKGRTDIPFAKQVSEMIYPGISGHDFRLKHFENRYRSIDSMLNGLGIKNILELSSGFSFRGLETVKRKGYHYIDTDLPGVIGTKRKFLEALLDRDPGIKIEGKLETLPLNALDEKEFNDIADRFPDGEIAIVNEGLLMYLDTAEKERLCGIIHELLIKRGGYWITADIYIKYNREMPDFVPDSRTREFHEKHRIEENKFESFDEAANFFGRMGFEIDKKETGKIRASWRLRALKV